jgi:hypothetical protein
MAIFFDIRLGQQGIEFIFFRFIVMATVRYDNIEYVESQKGSLTPWTAYRFVNRWISRRFIIHKKSAWFSKCVVVSPADKEMFEVGLRRNGVVVQN